MVGIYERFFALPVWLRRGIYGWFHRLLVRRDRDMDMRFMNYGYALDEADPPLDLAPQDEPNRYSIGMYWQMVGGMGLSGKDLLDVGCGRGGPAEFLARQLHVRRFVGLDLSAQAVRFCRAAYEGDRLSFVAGDAEALPFPDESFDAVLNVESCRNYPKVDRFLDSVRRVLRVGGLLLLADMNTDRGIALLKSEFVESGLHIENFRDITPNVLRALVLDEDRRQRLIERKAPGPLKGLFRDIAGLRGSERYRKLQTGALRYWSCRLRKVA